MINPTAHHVEWLHDEQDTFTHWVKVGLQRRFGLPQELPHEMLVLVDDVAARD